VVSEFCDFDLDGWCLEDGEHYHQAAPATFWIPTKEQREDLQPGDLAKLIFRINVDDPEDPTPAERMWVIVRKRIAGGYLGILDNDPDALAENGRFCSGIELPFEPRHLINILPRDESSIKLATETPRRPWPRDEIRRSAFGSLAVRLLPAHGQHSKAGICWVENNHSRAFTLTGIIARRSRKYRWNPPFS
jgi:hypothetical protein